MAHSTILEASIEYGHWRGLHALSIGGVTWDKAWAGRVDARCGAHTLPFIGRAEFIRNKRAAGRLGDLADIEALEG